MSLTRPVERLLGLSREETELLSRRAQARLGKLRYSVRLAAFLIGASPGTRLFVPRRARERAISPLLHALLPGPSENLVYARARRPGTEGRRDG
jgi:hypothetical protein